MTQVRYEETGLIAPCENGCTDGLKACILFLVSPLAISCSVDA